jgi:hypothetical protein
MVSGSSNKHFYDIVTPGARTNQTHQYAWQTRFSSSSSSGMKRNRGRVYLLSEYRYGYARAPTGGAGERDSFERRLHLEEKSTSLTGVCFIHSIIRSRL